MYTCVNDPESIMAEKASSDIDCVLKNAVEELLTQKSSCFTVESIEPDNGFGLTYDTTELSEYMNFDMLGEEDDNLESFQNLVSDMNLEDLTYDKLVLKAILNHGEYCFYISS